MRQFCSQARMACRASVQIVTTLCFMKTPALCVALLLSALFLVGACRKQHTHEFPPASPPAVLPGPKLYVAAEMSHAVVVIDVATATKVATIHLTRDDGEMMMPHNVQAAPDGKTIWATGVPMVDGTDETVFVIDPMTNTVLKKISLGVHQHLAHVVLDDSSRFSFVTAGEADAVIQIDAETYTEVRRFYVGALREPHGLRYSNGKLYIANYKGKSFSVIDVATGDKYEVPLGSSAVQMAVTPNGRYVFASLYDTREIICGEIQTAALKRIPLPAGAQGPIQLYPTPDSKLLYVCDQGGLDGRPASNKVYMIDVDSGAVIHTITAGTKAHGVVVDNQGRKAYVTNAGDGTVSFIDIATQQVVKTVAVGSAPNGIAYWYETGGMP